MIGGLTGIDFMDEAICTIPPAGVCQGCSGFALVLRVLRTQHHETVSPDNFGVHGFAIRAGHHHLLLKAKGLLVKGQECVRIPDWLLSAFAAACSISSFEVARITMFLFRIAITAGSPC